MQGVATCGGGAWSACAPSGTIVSSVGTDTASTGLRIQSGPTACDDPCNPECRYFTPDDGGVSTTSSSDGGTYVSGTTLPPAWSTVNKSPCAGPADCEFDTHCVAGTCVPYKPGQSSSCAGVDLTMPPACDGVNGTVFPICNRGSVSATTGIVKLGFDMNPPPSGTCAPTASPYPGKGTCAIDLSQIPIAAGKCVDINPLSPQPGATCDNAVNISGNRDAFINYTGTLAECNKCNNEGVKAGGASCTTFTVTSYQTTSYVQQYTATCANGKIPQWSALAYVASVPSSDTASRVVFTGRLGTGGDAGTWTSPTKLADTNAGDPAICGMFGPAPCPKDLTVAFKISRPVLELTITLYPSADGLVAPKVSTWQVTYNCVDSL